MAVIGIDLGTTNSLAVAYRKGQVEMIPNQFNEYLTPSVVSINENQELIVGKIAKERLVTHPDLTTNLFKRNMGSNIRVNLGKKSFLPEELSALVVKQLVADAQSYLNEEIEELVISVPAYFNAKQRKATKEVGKILGIKVERLINEPSAAAIACHQSDDYETFIVFDFGGGTLDVSVVDCFDNVVSITAIAGDNQLGGSDFDQALANHFCKQNQLELKQLSNSMQESILLNSERVKIKLQDEYQTIMQVCIDDKIYQSLITQDDLQEIAGPIFNKVKTVIAKAVKDSGFGVDELDNFILVGGSSYMPIVKEYLTALIRIPVVQNEEIDLLVAKGLGKYIGIKQRDAKIKNMVVTDICPFTLSTATYNETNPDKPFATVIIPRNTVLPTSQSKILSVIELGQTDVKIDVYQGEAMYAKDNLFLGTTKITVPKNKKEKETFKITYSYDINSMLYIELEIMSTGEKHVLSIGDDNLLQRTTNLARLNAIKDISLKLHQNPQIDLLLERANRIYEEVDDYTREQLVKLISDFNTIIIENKNNLHRKMDIIDQFDLILSQFESHNDLSNLDIFNNDSGDLIS